MPDERQRSLSGLGLDLLLLAALSFILDTHQPAIVEALRPAAGLAVALGLHILALLAMVLLGLRLALGFWHHACRRRRRAAAGPLLALAAGLVLYQAASAGAYVLAARDLHAIALARGEYPDAMLQPLEPWTIRIKGALGPNLMRDFRAAAAAGVPVARIEITSPGGLVAPALELAGFVERHGLTVVVRGECLSACVPIALAAGTSLAEPDAVFGFHRVVPAVEVARHRQERLTPDLFAHLRRHGVPEAVLRAAALHDAGSMHLVPAGDMVAMGVIDGIQANGRP